MAAATNVRIPYLKGFSLEIFSGGEIKRKLSPPHVRCRRKAFRYRSPSAPRGKQFLLRRIDSAESYDTKNIEGSLAEPRL